MNRNFKKIVSLIGWITSLVINLKIITIYRKIKVTIFSKIAGRSFQKVGINFILYPSAIINGAKYISIGNDFIGLHRLRIEAISNFNDEEFYPEIIIGDNVIINTDCHIGCINKIVIGNNVLMGGQIFISDHFHGDIDSSELNIPPFKRKLRSKGPVIIGENVWIGEKVTILPNVKIGNNVIIGANAVVTKDIPDNCVAAGVPAKITKHL